ncbi:membrane protein insertase YidC [Pseudomaricurvus alkylphenolicus]|uniref:membrane protein insertase YidC n=1 Tax=Pseudomaricurvus alkylphenolicus TaxID=1306991 RepID=UPI00141EDA64|nr:membrane protein insertase YidC [Pseudomaricurvus alkylphenolicus]NIB39491.1 membrane protein insertase YidC [Pseudomaricurvus alkylphenolicus]
MDWQRTLILGAIAVVSLLLINEWGDFQDRNRPQVSQQTTVTTTAPQTAAPQDNTFEGDIPSPSVATSSADIAETPASTQLIEVETDTLSVLIDPTGGDIVKVALLEQLASLDTPDEPFTLLNRTEHTVYIAQSGLIGPNATDTARGRPLFRSARQHYRLEDGSDQLNVDLELQQGDTRIVKRFVFRRGDNLVDLEYHIDNRNSPNAWQAGLFAQIKRDSHNPVVVDGFGIQPYLGAALTTAEENYKKLDFGDLADEDMVRRGGFKTTIQGGWIAMVQHYFLSAWIPVQDQENSYHLRKSGGDIFLLGFKGPQISIAAGSEGIIQASFYAGPKNIDRLEVIAPYLDLTVDYGWLWWIAKPLFQFLNFIYGLLGSWGWSIIALTVIIKLVFFPLSAASYRSMAKMRKFGPEMQRMKELYGDDRQKMSQEMMKLYQKEKINPLGGCLPILVQMPVFIALYWVLMESVELRHTPFLGWIDDLSVKDPYFILPLIMGITMWVQQKLNPTPPDPTQARIMQMMPFVFTFMFLWFPAGLVLYWVVNNTLSIAQQYVITKQIESGEKD